MKPLEAAQNERNRAYNAYQRVGLAHQDMRIALDLLGQLEATPEGHGPLRFGLETGVAVVYSRPFTGNGVGRITGHDPESDRDKYLHTVLLDMRDEVYAHTDVFTTSRRRMQLPYESEHDAYIHEWPGWLPGVQAEITAMIARQEAHLRSAAEDAQRELEERQVKVDELEAGESAS